MKPNDLLCTRFHVRATHGESTKVIRLAVLLMACSWLLAVLSFARRPDLRNDRGPLAKLAKWASVRPLLSALTAGPLLGAVLAASVGGVGWRLLAIASAYGMLFGLAGVLIRRRLGHA